MSGCPNHNLGISHRYTLLGVCVNEDTSICCTEAVAAELLSVSVRTLQQWRHLGRGPPYIRVSNRCVRYLLADLDDWLAEHRIEPDRRN